MATNERPTMDGSGYSVREEDLLFLGIGDDSFAAYKTGTKPLGIEADEWSQFLETLDLALKNDGIHQADIRLQHCRWLMWCQNLQCQNSFCRRR